MSFVHSDSRQALLFDADKDSQEDALDVSQDTIEMSSLDEIPVTPARRDTYRPTTYGSDGNDSDEDEDVEDRGDQALLGSRSRSRGRERTEEHPLDTLSQVKRIVLETAPTLLLTTVGLLFTGEILESVSQWKAMTRIDELMMLIPVVLNLKGNLEMNLSARLGTSANMGDLDIPEKRRSIILGNLTLLQVQATVVSFFAAIVAFAMSKVVPNAPDFESAAAPGAEQDIIQRLILRGVHKKPHRPIIPPRPSGSAEFVMVASSAMCAACLSSVLLGSFMCGLVVLCRWFGLDPDNIAPPVAACLGDLVTLSLLGLISEAHLGILETPIPLIFVITLSIAAVGWTIVTNRNEHVRHLLTEGWSPLFLAMAISTGTGIVLDSFVERYTGFALLAVVIAGLPGGVSAIFVSRLSTALHATTTKMSSAMASVTNLQENLQEKHYPKPLLVMLTLIAVSIPVEIIFLACVTGFGWLHLPFLFIVLKVMFFLVAITISLVVAQLTTTFLWKWHLDPDMYALPCQSALTDLVGQLLLVACYELASLLGVKVALKHRRKSA